MNDWDKYIDGVTDKESLLHFMKMLIDDYRKNPQEWEHDSIDEYLEGASKNSPHGESTESFPSFVTKILRRG